MKARFEKFNFEFPSKISSLRKLEKVLKELKKQFNIPDEDYDRIYLASSEAFVNAVVHGNKLDPAKKVQVKFKIFKRSYEIEIKDQGEGFDPSSILTPVDEENLLKESGRGIYIMRATADVVKFHKTSKGMKVKIKIKKRPSA